jgi:hypothetical protein
VFKFKKGESDQHKLLKTVSARVLASRGYSNIETEKRLDDGSSVDVVGKNGENVIIVECETLSRYRDALSRRFRQALLFFPHLKRVFCMSKFVDFQEIWLVDPYSGSLTCYFPKEVVADDNI